MEPAAEQSDFSLQGSLNTEPLTARQGAVDPSGNLEASPRRPDAQTVSGEELEAIVREVRDRVRARYPDSSAGPMGVPLADLMPVVRARDAAEAKVAAIGTVNPRRGGPLNALIQAVKRLVSRGLDWHVREQVEFNRGMTAAVDALIESLNEVNRSLIRVGEHLGEMRQTAARLESEAAALQDIRSHWAEWRQDWEHKLARNETQFLRSLAEVQGAFQHRTAQVEANFRDLVRAQHSGFATALERGALDIQKRVFSDLAEWQGLTERRTAQMETSFRDLVRGQHTDFERALENLRSHYERLIHNELRLLRQRAELAPPPQAAGAAPSPVPRTPPPEYDALAFAARFRGDEDSVRLRQRFYLPYFAGRHSVLDVGCGRGEFLELLREAGVAGQGIDLGAEPVAMCRAKGLAAEDADLFAYLAAAQEGSLDGIFCAQVVEHLPPERLPEFVRLAARSLAPGGVIAVETPNPECLAIFAVHFYLDPTHVRPVPHPLMAFYLEEAGFGEIEVHKLSPAMESMPEVAGLPAEFRDRFFGGLDYAIIGRRL